MFFEIRIARRIAVRNFADALRRTMAAHACRFEPVFENGSFEVYRFLHECTDAT